MNDATRILHDLENEYDPSVAKDLLPLVYSELKRVASAKLRREKTGHYLQTTLLVHEAYVRLVDVNQSQHWNSRRHFFAAAAEAMRRILVEEARKRRSQKRGGDFQSVSGLSRLANRSHNDDDRTLAINEALDQFEQIDPRASQVVKLKFFANMTNEETAEAMQISVPTVKRDWATAKVWIYRHLRDSGTDSI
jgi:RNA polymerase sigma factor (TIGR02999 family)